MINLDKYAEAEWRIVRSSLILRFMLISHLVGPLIFLFQISPIIFKAAIYDSVIYFKDLHITIPGRVINIPNTLEYGAIWLICMIVIPICFSLAIYWFYRSIVLKVKVVCTFFAILISFLYIINIIAILAFILRIFSQTPSFPFFIFAHLGISLILLTNLFYLLTGGSFSVLSLPSSELKLFSPLRFANTMRERVWWFFGATSEYYTQVKKRNTILLLLFFALSFEILSYRLIVSIASPSAIKDINNLSLEYFIKTYFGNPLVFADFLAYWKSYPEALWIFCIVIPVLIAGVFLFLLAAALRRSARRIGLASLDELRKIDQRRPILFLRPFLNEEVLLPSDSSMLLSKLVDKGIRSKNIEHLVVEQFSSIGPVVAIGNPTEMRPPLGAARRYIRGGNWKDDICDLIRESSCILIVYAETEGVLWEIDEIFRQNAQGKTLFLFFDEFLNPRSRKSFIYEKLGLTSEELSTLLEHNAYSIGLHASNMHYSWFLVKYPNQSRYLVMLRLFARRIISI